MMATTPPFAPLPPYLSDEQRRDWQRRQATAASTLDLQVLGGTTPNADTIACFQRYVRGETTLAQAIAQVREQMAEEHATFRRYLDQGLA